MTSARRLGFFSAVASTGFLLQLGIMLVLTRVFDWYFVWAALMAVEAAIVHNYFAHTRWTWADRPATTFRERLVRPLRYQGATTLSLTANLALTVLCVTKFGLEPVLANVVAVAFCAVLNYQLSDRAVFVER